MRTDCFQLFLEVKWWNFYIKASVLLCLLSVNTGFLWLVHVPLSRYQVIVEGGLHPPHQDTVDAAGEAGWIHSRARRLLKVRFYKIACWKLQLLTAYKKKGESHLPFRQHSDTNYQAIKRLRAAMWQQQMQPRRPSDAGLVSKQRKATNSKQRRDGWSWNVTIKDAGQIIAIKTGGEWRRVGQTRLLPFGHAVIHQQAQQQGLGGSAGRADTWGEDPPTLDHQSWLMGVAF